MCDRRTLLEADIDLALDDEISDEDVIEHEENISSDEYDSDVDPEYVPNIEPYLGESSDEDQEISGPIRQLECTREIQPKKKQKTSGKGSKKNGDSNKTQESNNITCVNPNGGVKERVVVPNVDTMEGKDNFVWQTKCTENTGKTLAKNVVHIRPGPNATGRDAFSPTECFQLFFSENMLQNIITHTNEEISRKRALYKSPLDGSLKDLCDQELRALFGILILAGSLKDNHLSTKTMFDSSFSGDKYRATMSERRFSFLIDCLRFDDKLTRELRKAENKLAAISELWEMLIENCKLHYKASSYVTIDEQLVGFRGKCPFRMYLPSKPNKYGLKIVLMCDNSSKYMLNAIPYLGKGTVPERKPVAEYFVEKLVGPISGSNRNLTTDNWFTSLPLAQHLLDECHITTVGTIKKNKRELPIDFKNLRYKERQVGSSLFLYHKDITAVSYKSKANKLVTLISTMHQGATINENSGKPEIIMTYNATKGSVDTFDQLCQSANCGRKTKRWPLCFFYNMLNIAVINAFVIYVHNYYRTKNDKPLSRQRFMIKLHEDLCADWQRQRLSEPKLSRELRNSIIKVLGIENPRAVVENLKGRRTYCSFCDWKKKRMSDNYCSCGKVMCGEHQVKKCPDCA